MPILFACHLLVAWSEGRLSLQSASQFAALNPEMQDLSQLPPQRTRVGIVRLVILRHLVPVHGQYGGQAGVLASPPWVNAIAGYC